LLFGFPAGESSFDSSPGVETGDVIVNVEGNGVDGLCVGNTNQSSSKVVGGFEVDGGYGGRRRRYRRLIVADLINSDMVVNLGASSLGSG
jgi:hypothetical protein